MLTPTDLHLLVGLLTRISRPEGVAIELGSMVFDEAAEELRDIDITITSVDDSGKVAAFDGIEVKRHKRPLDVGQVEQLCVKFVDMPSITSRAIVSASGYTAPSVKKAKYYGVSLYELKKLTPPMELNGVVIQANSMNLQENVREWLGTPNVSFNTDRQIPPGFDRPEAKVTDKQGLPIAGVHTLQQLADRVLRNSLHQANKELPENQFPVNDDKKVHLRVTLTDEPQIWVGDQRFTLTSATVEAVVRCRLHSNEADFMVLVEHGSDVPIIGYAIAKLQTGNLFGVTVDNHRRVSSICIPIADRLLEKIYRRKMQ